MNSNHFRHFLPGLVLATLLAGCDCSNLSVTCAAPTWPCGDRCVDLNSDPNHCGDCDIACGAGEVCYQGLCIESCPAGTEDCDRACVFLDSDERHCGECNRACPMGVQCIDGDCEESCVADCLDRECGLDPVCGTLDCGSCALESMCDDSGHCQPICTPDCTGRICGDDGCGGSCGVCNTAAGEVCVEASGQCAACTPDCAGRECGLEATCGSSCGTCPGGTACSPAGQCEEVCPTDCGDRVCGIEPLCGILDCGSCPAGEQCDLQGQCQPTCSPDCQGRVCGPDPVCGTLDCGTCTSPERCGADGQCQPACGEYCEPFSIVLLPDTQYYTKKQAAGPNNTLFKQMQWILDHRVSNDIRFVIHLGDITHNNTLDQWAVADAAYDLLEGAGMPYSIVTGNHDYLDGGDFSRGNTHFNEYFPPDRFASQAWYGGSLGTGNENNYTLFEVGPYKFLVVSLEYGPRKDALCWAEDIIAAHPDRRVILVSHCIQTHGGGHNTNCPSVDYLAPGGDGNAIWGELARQHSNLFLMVSGHVTDSEYFQRTGNAGNPVHEILTDYQMEGACTAATAAACADNCQAGFYTGNGWMRELAFAPRENRVYARTFTVEAGNQSVFPGGVPALFCSQANTQGKNWYAMDPAHPDHQFDFAYDFGPLNHGSVIPGEPVFVDQTVNTVSAGDQLGPVLASNLTGSFVVVWEDDSSDADGSGNFDIMVRGFQPDGCQMFSQRQVNPEGAGQQQSPAVGMAADGSFVVAWQDDNDGNGVFQIHARGFAADGSERIPRFTVNTESAGQQTRPAMAVGLDGRFAIAWEDDADGDGNRQIRLRGFNADGSAGFAERSAHADDNGNRQRPALAARADGGLVLVWEDDGDDNGVYQIHARGFTASGAESIPRFTVNTAAAGQQRNPVVACDMSGGFVVVWEDDQERDGDYQLLARGFEAGGSQRFSDRPIHTRAGGQHRAPALGVAGNGAFAAAWQDDSDGNGVYQIRAATFTATGVAFLPELTVNRIADGQQTTPGLALDSSGSMVVAWEDDMDGNGKTQLLARGLAGCLP